jgi:hypothetical protein
LELLGPGLGVGGPLGDETYVSVRVASAGGRIP